MAIFKITAALLYLGLYGNNSKDEEQHEHRNMMIESLLKPYDDELNFPEHVSAV